MVFPARPFVGRLLTEIAKLEGGLPAAADVMGIAPKAIDDLANGEILSPQDLRAIYAWLAAQVSLTQQEVEDYAEILAAGTSGRSGGLERLRAGRGGLPTWSNSPSRLPSPLLIGALVVLVGTIVLTSVVTAELVKSDTQPKAARPSPSRSSATPVAVTSSPVSSPTASTAATPEKSSAALAATVFRSGHLSIAQEHSGDNEDYYKNLKVNPPVTTNDDTKGDVYLDNGIHDDTTMYAVLESGVTVGLWDKSAPPSYSECLDTARAAGVGEINIDVGQRVCLQTSSGSVASLKLLSVNGFASSDFDATVWYPSSSPQP